MADISSEYKHQKQVFLKKAKEWTAKYAKGSSAGLEVISSSPEGKGEGYEKLPVQTLSSLEAGLPWSATEVELLETKKNRVIAEGKRRGPPWDGTKIRLDRDL